MLLRALQKQMSWRGTKARVGSRGRGRPAAIHYNVIYGRGLRLPRWSYEKWPREKADRFLSPASRPFQTYMVNGKVS